MTVTTGQSASDEDVLDHASASLTLHVRDLDASVRWYSSVFGTQPAHRGTDTSLDGISTAFAVFVLAGMKVFLSEVGADDHVEHDHESHPPTLVFMTRRPLGPLRRQIESRGALFKDEIVAGFPADADGVRAGRNAEFLWFYDLDGNKLEFCRVLKKD